MSVSEKYVDKVAIVTGVNGALGKSIVDRLSLEGYKIFGIDCVDNRSIDIDYFCKLDLNDFSQSANLQTKVRNIVKKKFPNAKISLLINNAAYQYVTSIHPIPHDIFGKSLNINVLAPYYLTVLFAEDLAKFQGCVVNISSIHARLTKKGFTAYSVSKAALSSLTRSLSLEYGEKFRINCIEPASIDTIMLREGFNFNQDKLDKLSEYHPQNKIATPEEIAELVHLISTEKVPFLHGSCIDVSGAISNVLHDPA